MADEMNKEREAAEQWLRDRYGAYRGHFAWRELEEAFLAGRASLAASAGSEPVAWTTGLNWQPDPRSQSEMVVKLTRCAQPQYGFTTPLYTHPSPPEGMAVTDAMIDAGKKMLHNRNGRGAREKAERIFNAMIAAAPPASEAKGASK